VRQRARTDKGHKAIVQALRKVGCQVFDASRCGSGFPDLVVRIPAGRAFPCGTDEGRKFVYIQLGTRIVLMEIKEPKGKLTPDQEDFIRDWPETVIVRSVQEALAAVGVR
jgi:hypothetical protein